MYQYTYNTPIGEITIAENNKAITDISYKQLKYDIKETLLIKKTSLYII